MECNDKSYKVGMIVKHKNSPWLGSGKIIKIQGRIITIDFHRAGIIDLDSKKTPLDIVQPEKTVNKKDGYPRNSLLSRQSPPKAAGKYPRNKYPRNMKKNVEGLIVDYKHKQKLGMVLLKSNKEQEFHTEISKYMNDTETTNYWFAKFSWRAITEKDRNQIYDFSPKKRKKTSCESINSFLKGRLALCDLSNDTVVSLKIDFITMKFSFSGYRKKYPIGGFSELEKRVSISTACRVEKRLYAKILKTENNIKHPYRG